MLGSLREEAEDEDESIRVDRTGFKSPQLEITIEHLAVHLPATFVVNDYNQKLNNVTDIRSMWTQQTATHKRMQRSIDVYNITNARQPLFLVQSLGCRQCPYDTAWSVASIRSSSL